MSRLSSLIPLLGRAKPAKNTIKRQSSFQPQIESLEARALMTAGGKITGIVFNDAIPNGVQDGGELPLAGITVFADSNGNGALDAGELSTKSGPDGSYSLTFNTDGAFAIRQIVPRGFAQTYANPTAINVAGGAAITNINFGDQRTLLPDQSFVDQAFRDLLGRGADAGALATFGTALDLGSMERPDVLQAIQGSTEFRSRQIDQLFSKLLHRSADPGAKTAFLQSFANGATSEQIEATIVASDEYFQKRGGGSNSGFATALYQDELGRNIDSGGLTNAQNFLAAGGSRLALTQFVQTSPEADAHSVRAIFQQFLRRDADADALAAFTSARHSGASDEQIGAAVASSDEYFQRFCL